jgi:hypothetical protein
MASFAWPNCLVRGPRMLVDMAARHLRAPVVEEESSNGFRRAYAGPGSLLRGINPPRETWCLIVRLCRQVLPG